MDLDLARMLRIHGSKGGPLLGRFLLVGEAPNRRMHLEDEEQSDALAIPRLPALAGIDEDSFCNRFARVNILPEWPGASPEGKGDAFPIAHARKEAARLNKASVLGHFDAVLFLGRRAASCFHDEKDRERFPWFEWKLFSPDPSWRGVYAAVAPHPSGASHWWNEGGNVDKARAFWRHLSTLAVHAQGCCRGKGIVPRFLEDGHRRRFPCEDARDVRPQGVIAQFHDCCVLSASVDTDGFTVDVRIGDGGGMDWTVSVLGEAGVHRECSPGALRIQAHGKSGSEGRVLADALEWIAGKLREVPS